MVVPDPDDVDPELEDVVVEPEPEDVVVDPEDVDP